ncbi:phosphohistidine phosphatase [Altererythrobacter atlanticus]|uniref:Histidine phosphatase superfamily (Branch 1) n=1 Tax=Croceibacterium atlanticum TaxID=1267766 RepID=A0A0F7KRW6_9SPHN|nr:histidine phosphatase family protein [Croceibacterium atlanticum]AKH41977.1 Histidine phosphatase superfamily (branch 1) [Croceibacterium atlanticum]MBB5733455.1 phosphohistidine phosphatase [Croceibacterium atlanticum]
MKLLGLLRHAKSDWEDLSLRDFDRGLNARGRRGAALMGDHIRNHGVKWERLVASPAERVKLTLEASGIGGPVEWERDAYLADADTLLTLLRKTEGDPRSLLMAGHNPGLQELIFLLVGDGEQDELYDAAARKYPTATYAVLELAIDDWADIAPGCGKLIHFARPRDLDPELGPERLGF